MKKTLIILCLFVSYANAQLPGNYENYYFTFEDTVHFNAISFPGNNNIWQIGIPIKPIFDTACQNSRVICTDTANSYPANNQSSFIIHHRASLGYWLNGDVIISAWFYLDCDSIHDYATIELSIDSGKTWLDFINDPTFSQYIIWMNAFPPILTGKSGGWEFFSARIDHAFLLNHQFNFNDIILYKFTFITDSIDNNKAGLMFDNFSFTDYYGSIDEYSQNDRIVKYPNPANDYVTFQFPPNTVDGKVVVSFSNMHGQTIEIKEDFISNRELRICTSSFTPGLWFYTLTTFDETHSGRLLIIE